MGSRKSQMVDLAAEYVREALQENHGSDFVQTCDVCNRPLRDKNTGDEPVVVEVTSMTPLNTSGTTDHTFRCTEHSRSAKELTNKDYTIVSYAVVLTVNIDAKNNEIEIIDSDVFDPNDKL